MADITRVAQRSRCRANSEMAFHVLEIMEAVMHRQIAQQYVRATGGFPLGLMPGILDD